MTVMVGTRVQVRTRQVEGDGVIVGLAPKTVLVRLEGEAMARRFAKRNVRVVRYRGKREPWEDSPRIDR